MYIELIQTVQVKEVKMDKDFSDIVYDHFSGNRNRYNDRQYQQSETQSAGTFVSSQMN